jgi:hypothetical protein
MSWRDVATEVNARPERRQMVSSLPDSSAAMPADPGDVLAEP